MCDQCHHPWNSVSSSDPSAKGGPARWLLWGWCMGNSRSTFLLQWWRAKKNVFRAYHRSPKFLHWSSNTWDFKLRLFGGKIFGEWWSQTRPIMWVLILLFNWYPYEKRRFGLTEIPRMSALRGQSMQGHNTFCKPWRGKPNPADTLLLDFQPPELHFYCSGHFSHSGWLCLCSTSKLTQKESLYSVSVAWRVHSISSNPELEINSSLKAWKTIASGQRKGCPELEW